MGNVVNIVSARRVHQNDWQTSGVPFYRAREIVRLSESGEADNELFISEELFAEFSKSGRPKPNDLMVTAVGTIGTCYIVKPNDRFYYKDATVLCFENIGHISADYLLHLMHSPYMHNLMHSKSAGTTVNTITMVKANNYLIPLPPLAEQHRIITKIKGLMSKVGEYAKAAQQFAEFEAKFPADLKKAILQAAVEGKLVPQDQKDEPASVLVERIAEERRALVKAGKLKRDKHESVIFRGSDRLTYETRDGETVCIEDELPFKIPESWAWVRLGSICSFIHRGKSPQYSPIKKYPVVAQKCNQWSGFCIEKAQFIDPKTITKYTQEQFLQDDDLLWNSTGLGTLGRMAMYSTSLNPYKIAVADCHVTVIRVLKDFVDPRYVFAYLTGPSVQSTIEDKADGSTKQKELATSTVISYLVPLPPLAEQKRIVAQIEKMLKASATLTT